MIVRVCIPCRVKPGTWRERAFDYTFRFWQSTWWPVHAADSNGPVFCSAQARNNAAAGDWDVAVFVDADKIVHNTSVLSVVAAVQYAWDTGEYTVFHDRICYLTRTSTRQLLTSNEVPERAYTRKVILNSWEDGFAIRRDLWDAVGGYDERFYGYGYHGIAFAAAAGTIGGRHRIPGTLVHLWHQPRHRNPDHMEANRVLLDEYLQFLDQPNRMRYYHRVRKAVSA